GEPGTSVPGVQACHLQGLYWINTTMNTLRRLLICLPFVVAAFIRPDPVASMNQGTANAAETMLTRFTLTEPHMGTRFKIILYAPDEATARKAAQAAFERIGRLDHTMSDYRSTSELMQLCRKAGGEPVKVSDELFFVLAHAQQVSKL